jgi:hypothetical protein
LAWQLNVSEMKADAYDVEYPLNLTNEPNWKCDPNASCLTGKGLGILRKNRKEEVGGECDFTGGENIQICVGGFGENVCTTVLPDSTQGKCIGLAWLDGMQVPCYIVPFSCTGN